MRRIIAHTLIVGSIVCIAFLSMLAVRAEIHSAEVYERAHYGPLEVQGPPYRATFTMATPEELLSASAKAEKNHKPQTKE